MADDVDRAKILEEQARKRGIDAVRFAVREEPETNKHGERICKECGDIIKKMRLMVMPHAVRCVPCQEQCEGRR